MFRVTRRVARELQNANEFSPTGQLPDNFRHYLRLGPPSRVHRGVHRGVYATNTLESDIALGEILGSRSMGPSHGEFEFADFITELPLGNGESIYIDSTQGSLSSWCRFINTSEDPNAPYNCTFTQVEIEGVVRAFVTTTRRIRRGEELICDYLLPGTRSWNDELNLRHSADNDLFD
jgi:hypothetical protein